MKSHQQRHQHSSDQNLGLAFFLNLGFSLLEVVGGLYTNSVAILSDALHDFGDSLSLGLSWWLNKKSKQLASKRFTYGYRRFSLLGALVNGLVLVAGSVLIISEALKRLQHPTEADASGMVIFAVLGIVVNGYAAWRLRSGESLNEKVVSWHLLEDVLGWLAVLIAALLMLFWDLPWLDPALSIAISLFVLYNVIRRLGDTSRVFLQGKPADIDLDQLKERILSLKHVRSLHHTHLWTLDGEHHVFTAHVKLENIDSFEQIIQTKEAIKASLKDYNFEHYTIETELDAESCELN